jgi:hypothetical protein
MRSCPPWHKVARARLTVSKEHSRAHGTADVHSGDFPDHTPADGAAHRPWGLPCNDPGLSSTVDLGLQPSCEARNNETPPSMVTSKNNVFCSPAIE